MNRRNFCRLSALALAGAALGVKAQPRPAGTASHEGVSVGACRVTVLRRCCFADLQSRYLDDPDAGCCEAFAEGQTFDVGRSAACPEGFCPLAWQSIRPHVEGVLGSALTQECGLTRPTDRAVIACCADGTRPVVFKIERV